MMSNNTQNNGVGGAQPAVGPVSQPNQQHLETGVNNVNNGQQVPSAGTGPGTPTNPNVQAVSAQPQQQNSVVQTQGQIQQQQQQSKEINAITLCRLGQDTIQEIISRTHELFQILRQAQPPDGKYGQIGLDKKHKFQETLRFIKASFKRLRVIHDKLEEGFPSDKVVHHEAEILQRTELDSPIMDERKNTEAYKIAVEEYREVVEQVMIRNRQIKDVMDQLRQIIWDVNTMLAMRKEDIKY